MRIPVIPFTTNADIDAAAARAAAHLREGKLLAHPTETVYGVGSSLQRTALERLAGLKGREGTKPFVVLIGGLEMLDQIGVGLSGAAARLAAAHWPGPLTLVVPSAFRQLPPLVRTERGVGVRWTPHPGMQRVVRALGAPVTSSSANRTGLPPATRAEEIATTWAESVGDGEMMVLDGGVITGAVPSTVVDCVDAVPRVLRAGAIGLDALRVSVPELVAGP